jgi:hypothetical protein
MKLTVSYSPWKQNGMVLCWTYLQILAVHMYCHMFWQMVASRGGVLIGDSSLNYIENFCYEASMGRLWVAVCREALHWDLTICI